MKILSATARPLGGVIRPELAIVSSLGAHAAGRYVLVSIAADDGSVGVGEATVTAVWSGETQSGALALFDEVFQPILVGADPFDVAWIQRRWEQAAHGNPFLKSAVETALLDLQGKILRQPLYRLIGGKNPLRSDVRLKFVVGAGEPAAAAQRAGTMVDAGWNAIKVKVGATRRPQDDLERLSAVRQAIGPDVWLSVDANGAFTVRDAVWLARRMEPLDVQLFEQPTRRGRCQEMRQVRRHSPIPIMADESVFTFEDALEVLRTESADVLSVYPGKHGGIRAMQEVCRLAEAHGVPCTIGSNLEREVATAAMAHAVAATPNVWCEKYPGDLIGPLYFCDPLCPNTLQYRADRLQVPDGKGLGIELAAAEAGPES